MISLERKRSERSRKPFLLMLVEVRGSVAAEDNGQVLTIIMSSLSVTTRETDLRGWHVHDAVVGVMFTEIGIEDRNTIAKIISRRINGTLASNLSSEQLKQLRISFHVFPEEWNHDASVRTKNPTLYPDLDKRDAARKLFRAIKRVMDVSGAIIALTLSLPMFLVVAIAIKANSKGPVLFRQRRIGQDGKAFTFLKFRSMYVNNDASAHKEYVTQLIAGKASQQPTNGHGNGQGVYKLTSDPRVTRVGSFLRKTSLDELPQLINVLKGEMSLVGPRPAVPYEVEAYDVWHRRRLLEAKPGITGLWQVSGRSRVKFDDMVRLDLHYARNWSPWMDLKILLRTPAAVVLGEGAH